MEDLWPGAAGYGARKNLPHECGAGFCRVQRVERARGEATVTFSLRRELGRRGWIGRWGPALSMLLAAGLLECAGGKTGEARPAAAPEPSQTSSVTVSTDSDGIH